MAFRWVAQNLPELRFAIAERFSIECCLACGTHVTAPRPSEEYLAALYSRHYVPPDYCAPDAHAIRKAIRSLRCGDCGLLRRWELERSTEVPALFLLPETARHLPAHGKVLDVGAYTGENMLWLEAAGWDVVGLEPNAQAASIARQLGLDVRMAPVEHACLPDNTFDAAYLSYVIEHLREPRFALLELHRMLRKGGRLLVTTHNVHSTWRYVFGPYWFHWHTPFHLFHTHPRSLRTLIENVGFKTVLITTRTPVQWLLYSIRAMRDAVLADRPNKALYTPVAGYVHAMLRGLLLLERMGLQGDCTIGLFERID